MIAAATHGLFVGRAGEVIGGDAIKRTLVTDSVPPFRLDSMIVEVEVTVLTAAPLFAETIDAIHENGSIVDLLEG